MSFFQNCSGKDPFSYLQSNETSADKLSGNGEGYEGKPKGDYLRYIPGFKCGEQFGLESAISVSSDGIYHRQSVNKESCALQDEIVPRSKIIDSPFQKDFIVFDDFLYEKFSIRPETAPVRLGEVLCRDSFESPTSELVAHYDSSNRTADLSFYGDLADLSLSHPSRIYSFQGMTYKTDNYELKIDFQNHIPNTGRFPGVLTTEQQSKNMDCVVGGEIDRTIWPVKKEVEAPVSLFFTGLPESKAAFIYGERQGDSVVHKLLQDNGKRINLSEGILKSPNSGSCCNIRMSETKNQAVLGDWIGVKSKYYYADFNLNKKTEINLFGFDDNGYIGFYPSVLRVGEITLIHGYSKILNKHALIMYRDVDGSTLLDQFSWTTILTQRASNNLHYVTLVGQILYFNELDLSTLKIKRTLASELGFVSLSTEYPFYELATSGLYLNQQILNSDTTFSEFRILDLNLGKTTIVATNVQSVWNSKDNNLFLLCDLVKKYDPINKFYSVNCEGDYKKLYIVSLNKIIELSNPIKKIDSSLTEQLYAAIAESKEGNIFALSADIWPSIIEITTAGTRELSACHSDKFKPLTLLQDDLKNTYVLSQNNAEKVYEISKIQSGSCVRVNQFPAVTEYLTSIRVLDGGFSVVFAEISSHTKNQVVFVPTSGRSAILLNPDSKEFSFNGFMQMSADHTKVFLVGYSVIDQSSYLYSFNIK